jgi:hypothetical protein
MNKPMVFVAGLAVGAMLAGVVAYVVGGGFLLWGLYMDAAAGAQANVAILRELQTGDTDRAKLLLNRFLETNEAILKACEQDLCSAISFGEVEKAIDIIDEYRAVQQDGSP